MHDPYRMKYEGYLAKMKDEIEEAKKIYLAILKIQNINHGWFSYAHSLKKQTRLWYSSFSPEGEKFFEAVAFAERGAKKDLIERSHSLSREHIKMGMLPPKFMSFKPVVAIDSRISQTRILRVASAFLYLVDDVKERSSGYCDISHKDYLITIHKRSSRYWTLKICGKKGTAKARSLERLLVKYHRKQSRVSKKKLRIKMKRFQNDFGRITLYTKAQRLGQSLLRNPLQGPQLWWDGKGKKKALKEADRYQ